MADNVTLIEPQSLQRNKENPRLIFRKEELDALQKSIADQGILVPLTVYKDGRTYRLLDGERRWRCAKKLRLQKIPVVVQPKPERLQNIMMMFAIHHAREDWDPLPTALKLEDLEAEFRKRHDRRPTETELAGLASLSRGEVRRLKKLLALPSDYREELLRELKKPRPDQVLTADHVLEASTAASRARKTGIVDEGQEDSLRKAIIKKFRSGVIKNTVAPRKIARIARAVTRKEVAVDVAREAIRRLIKESTYDIDAAFRDSVAQVDYEHSIEQIASRLEQRLTEHRNRGYKLPPKLRDLLKRLSAAIESLVS